MRFTSALVAGSLAFVASAQETTQPSATVSIDPAQQSVIDCVESCDATDIGCLARCNPVPNPNDDQVEAAHDCITECDQGDGTLEQTEAFARCQAACVKQHYYDSTAGTPQPTGGNGGGNGGNGGNEDAETTADSAPTTSGGAAVTSGTATATVTETTAAPTGSETGSETGTESGSPSGTETGDGASETGEGEDGDNGASGIFASTAAIFGAAVAFFAL